jgi:hypothetical protein
MIQQEAVLPIHIIGMKLDRSHFPDDVIHVSRFGGEDAGVM